MQEFDGFLQQIGQGSMGDPWKNPQELDVLPWKTCENPMKMDDN